MTAGKASDPSGVVVEMVKASGNCGIRILCDLVNVIISHNSIPTEWRYSYILNLYKVKEDAMFRNNYGGLKLMDHVIKIA